jgi:hypothetical protein
VTKTLFTTTVRYANGQVARNQAVTIFNRGAETLPDLYEDAAATIPLTNPLRTDYVGNLAFYLDPGYYDIEAYDVRVPFDITSIGDGSAIVAQVSGLESTVVTLGETVSTHISSPRPHQAAESGRDFAGWYNAGIA